MEKTNCNIVRDLLPLYEDDVCSEDTKSFVENHLADCESCKNELEKIKKCPDITEKEKSRIDVVKSAGRKIKKNKKKAVIKAVALSLTVCIILGVFTVCECIRSSLKNSFWNSPICAQGAAPNFGDNPQLSFSSLHNGKLKLGNCRINLPKKYRDAEYKIENNTFGESENAILSFEDGETEKKIIVTFGKYNDYNIPPEDSFGTGFFDRLFWKLVDMGAKAMDYKGIDDDDFLYYLYYGEPPEFYDGLFASPVNKLKSFAFYCGIERCVPLFGNGFRICSKTDDGCFLGFVINNSSKEGTSSDYTVTLDLPLKDGITTNISFRNFTFNEAEEIMASLDYQS